MEKPRGNYAFIDGINLHLTYENLDWLLDYRGNPIGLYTHKIASHRDTLLLYHTCQVVGYIFIL